MKKKFITMALGLSIFLASPAMPVSADGATVATIGANLDDAQREKIFDYFGIKESSVEVLTITNKDEREYLEGVASEAQIGRRTYSCAYIEPTKEGSGINIKTANLSWVTPYMIKSTLTTAGIYDCNVIAAAPFKVSGTGALTGIMKAFESVTGNELEEEKKELATEELVMTGELADEIGTEQATGIITEIKDSIIGENIIQAEKIEQVVIDSSKNYNVTLSDEQVKMITGTMEKVANQEYDYSRLKSTFKSITDSASEKLGIEVEEKADETEKEQGTGFIERIKEFFKGIFDWFKGLFTKVEEKVEEKAEEVKDLGILNQTNDDVFGEDAIIESTEDEVTVTAAPTNAPVEQTEAPTSSPEATKEAWQEEELTVTPEPTKEADEDTVEVTQEPTEYQ